MSGPTPLPVLTCRKCGSVNPMVMLVPVVLPAAPVGTCICMDCAQARGWLDREGNLKPGIEI